MFCSLSLIPIARLCVYGNSSAIGKCSWNSSKCLTTGLFYFLSTTLFGNELAAPELTLSGPLERNVSLCSRAGDYDSSFQYGLGVRSNQLSERPCQRSWPDSSRAFRIMIAELTGWDEMTRKKSWRESHCSLLVVHEVGQPTGRSQCQREVSRESE